MRLRVWRWTTEEGGGWCYYKRLGSAPNKLPHINEILLQPHHHTRANISISTLTLQLPVLYSSSNLQAHTNITPDLFEIIQISSSLILISFGDTGDPFKNVSDKKAQSGDRRKEGVTKIF